MGRGAADDYDFSEEPVPLAPSEPEHLATVGPFYLDEHEVTVARFRAFIAGFDGKVLVAGAGAHPRIPDSGWDPTWVAGQSFSAPEVLSDLQSSGYTTWTDEPGVNEQLPIARISWLTAFQFCVWDGGRLPTEAEWEFAAAGGEENRLFPWGAQAATSELANFGSLVGHHLAVGSLAGVARWGQTDMAGGVSEWVLDAYDSDEAEAWYSKPCNECANVAGPKQIVRVEKGGGFFTHRGTIRAAARGILSRESWDIDLGVRCARDAPRSP